MGTPSLAAALSLLFLAAGANAGDWPAFRGPNRNGVSPESKAPLTWSADKNIKWRVALPQPGNSSPVVFGGKVFLTCADDAQGTRRSLYCLDSTDGKQLWVQTVRYDTKEPTHPKNPYCGSTPAADAKHVVVWHGSAGVHCYDHDGKELWSRDLGTFRHIWGYAASPVIHGNAVYLNCGPGEHSFVTALNLSDGTTIWKTDEPGGADDKNQQGSWVGSWATPSFAMVDGAEQLILPMSQQVNAYDPASGKILWTCAGIRNLSYEDVMLGDGVAVAASGYGGPTIGFKLGGSGDVTAANRLWRVEKNPQRIGSGVVRGKYLFMGNEPGFCCIEMTTGNELWKQRPQGQNFWAPMVAVGERIYVTSQQGKTFVFSADSEKFNLLATNNIGEGSNSAIAVADGQIFLRTFKALYCIEETSSR